MLVNAYKTIIYILASVPIITGLMNVFMGLGAQELIGAQLTNSGFTDPLLNSQMSFYGAIWFGFGVFLCVCLSDIRKYSSLLKAALLVTFVGGLGRVGMLAKFGLPSNEIGAAFVLAVVAIEIIGMPILLWWHSQLMAQA